MRMLENFSRDLRVASPGIIQSFDAQQQTVTVQLALRERISSESGQITEVQVPLLVDVPIVLPRAGGFSLTFPIEPGDECLVIFADSCIDAWFSNGGLQVPIENRRHDLSDSFAILGAWSQPRRISNYDTNNLMLRSEHEDSEGRFAYIKISQDNDIEIRAKNITSSQWG